MRPKLNLKNMYECLAFLDFNKELLSMVNEMSTTKMWNLKICLASVLIRFMLFILSGKVSPFVESTILICE